MAEDRLVFVGFSDCKAVMCVSCKGGEGKGKGKDSTHVGDGDDLVVERLLGVGEVGEHGVRELGDGERGVALGVPELGGGEAGVECWLGGDVGCKLFDLGAGGKVSVGVVSSE